MRPRLFLSGPSGCGKSTMIRKELGERIRRAGGFVTQRERDENGRVCGFEICSADGYGPRDRFLDLTGETPRIDLEVFSGVGRDYLRRAREQKFAILDEIGGVELFCPRFTAALYAVLESGVPILGVLKGDQPRTAMTEKLHLRQDYTVAAQALRQKLQEDPDTLIYECGQYDKNALLLARQWAEEYCHD